MNKYGKYGKIQTKENAIALLANNKKEVFSFQQIKPSLVFFNKDGHSLSIISNSKQHEREYQDLKALWNSQNVDFNNQEELVDYKSLDHEGFLGQIKTLFSLNNKTIDDLRNYCKLHGNYIFVSDNYIKIVRILLNIEAKIPVILMGETGVGKTKLLEVLSELYGEGTCIWKTLQIHAGITDQEIVDFIDTTIENEDIEENKDKLIWVFFDEINTCNSLGLITEIMCNHTYMGKKIGDNFIFIGACNPYRIITKKMKESGLVYYNMKENNNLNNLVYTVNPLPHSLLNFVFDFGNLQDEDEKKYIYNTIRALISKIENEKLIEGIFNNKNYIIETMINSIVICHNYIRELYDRSSVSMRELRRFGILFEYFITYFNIVEEPDKRIIYSLNLALYLCYYLRLNEKINRDELMMKLEDFFNKDFLSIPENVMRNITEKMSIEKNKGIALNPALKENLFSMFICITNKIPLIIIGKPGTSKSLSFQILYNTMKGQYSENNFFKDKGKIYRYYYQGSETSTSKGIQEVFSKAINAQKKNKDKNIITLVFFDEMGLSERSINNPLKVMHFLLEKDSENSVPFLGISNWRLDASKINRVLCLTITDYDMKDLEETAISIAEALDNELSIKYKEFFEILAKTYYQYIIYNQNKRLENKDFHGNRDFYNLIKNSMSELIKEKRENIDFEKNEKEILTTIGIKCLEINFGGLEYSTKKIKELFKKEYGHKFYINYNIEQNFPLVDIIKSNLNDSNRRYLMLVSEDNDASDIIKYILKSMKKDYIELVGSKYKNDIKSGKYSEEILNKIKYIMELDNILILRDLDMIYASLYDIFNQNFSCMGDKKYARIAFEYAKISSEINKDFRVIIIVNQEKIEELKLDPPFLNRFEKHIIDFRMLLNNKDIQISRKITNYLEIMCGEKNKDLKINLNNLLVNSKEHNLDGLIFKIKHDKNLSIENPEYENIMIEEIFIKMVPTFCQDIIAYILTSKIDIEYQKYNELILDIYKKSRFYNFEIYFENLQYKRNIIYTFSKITENIYDEEIILKNKYGNFRIQEIEIKIIESIKTEKDLIILIKSFTENKDKKILILKLSEKEFNQIFSINYVITNYEKENRILKDKIIIFTMHMQRKLKNKENKEIQSDFISFINDEYYQIFIDNFQGKEKYDIFSVLSEKTDILAKKYLLESDFIANKIYMVLYYLQIEIYNENENFNLNNCRAIIAENIINNKTLKQLFLNNLEKQGDKTKEIINKVFNSKNIEINDVDFYEAVNTKFKDIFTEYLLNIVIDSLKRNILLPFLYKDNIELFLEDKFFNNLIRTQFEKVTFNIIPKPRQILNSNRVVIYNEFILPENKLYFDKIIKYINDEMCKRYIINEESLRQENINQNKNIENYENYHKILERIKENIKVEINKEEYFNAIYNQNNNNFRKFLLQDYHTYFIIKCLNKIDIKFNNIKQIMDFYFIILMLKLSEKIILPIQFENTLDEFIDIILFTQGYFEDIIYLINIFISITKYCDKLKELIIKILNENIIKFETPEKANDNSKIVNYCWFLVIESLTRAILEYSIELFNKDKNMFFEYLGIFRVIEANLQKLNIKYYLYNKEIYNLTSIIKIQEYYKYNHDEFENNYINIINNLLYQTLLLYKSDYENYYKITIELNQIFDNSFEVKKDEYTNLRFFIFFQQYKILSDETTKIKLIEDFFQNPILIGKSRILLVETLKEMRPQIKQEKNYDFLNIKENLTLNKYEKLYNIYNNIKSLEFDELLLFTFENQMQSYFKEILDNNNGIYDQKSCKEIILENSLDYFIKAKNYLYEHQNDFNKLLKFKSIAYIKTYIHYLVEINYIHSNLCDFDQINKALDDENNNNILIRNIRNIYLWRVYLQKFENFEQLKNYNFIDFPIYNELINKLNEKNQLNDINNNKNDDDNNNAHNNDNNNQYIFTESFICPSFFEELKKLQIEMVIQSKNLEYDFNEDNIDFDKFYCALVNKFLSYLYHNEKDKYIVKLKQIYNVTNKNTKFDEEGNTLYQYLMNYDNFENNIVNKISEKPLNQKEFEILLYSLRFVLNILTNKSKCFYKELLKVNTYKFINNNYIPGAFPFINEFVKSYNDLEEAFTQPEELGYYICKDCGYLYRIPPCTLPMSEGKCPSGHVIGGIDHKCSKKDLRVFPNEEEKQDYIGNDSFISITLEEFKQNYVDKYIENKEKGIIQGYRNIDFMRNKYSSNLNIITYRILNFILYSFILSSYILDHITKEEAQVYMVENLQPHTLFCIITTDWNLLNQNLQNIGIENSKIFLNMIFEHLIEFMNKLESVNTLEQLEEFELEVNNYIVSQINDNKKIKEINDEYQKLNNELLNTNPNNIKELIISKYDPLKYSQEIFPDIQYYCITNIYNLDTFKEIFNSSDENKGKYSLINLLLNQEVDTANDITKMKNLININKLANLLIIIYSYKISREDGKKKRLDNELDNILDNYQEINNKKITKKEFIDIYINPFINSWNQINRNCVQYKCRILRDLEKGENPLNMKIDNNLCYFLVDDGDLGGGMFLASAYEYFIESQNKFIDDIITKNKMNGILNSYIPQLEQEINVQDANENEIIKIDNNTYQALDNLIATYSNRNIFNINEEQIYYKNYNDIKYDYNLIEEELGKLILPGIKKFKNDHTKIKFVTYLYEGFRGGNTDILVLYNNKYEQKELTENEKLFINRAVQALNNDTKIYSDIFFSLQILMNEILKENYPQNYLIYEIIIKKPKYVILNEELIKLINNRYNKSIDKNDSFTINSLISIFEYFEELCWEDIKKNIPEDFKIQLDNPTKTKILDYFENNNGNNKMIITKNDLADAIRKNISRYIVGTRQDSDLKPEVELKLYISKYELWPKIIRDNDLFDNEITKIFETIIFVGQSLDLYNILIDNNNDNKIIEIEKNDDDEEKIGNKKAVKLDNKLSLGKISQYSDDIHTFSINSKSDLISNDSKKKLKGKKNKTIKGRGIPCPKKCQIY